MRLAHLDDRAAIADFRVRDRAVRTAMNVDLLGRERVLHELDEARRAAGMKKRRHGSEARGISPAGEIGRDVPVIAGDVLHAGLAIAVRLVDQAVQRLRARRKHIAIDAVSIGT